MLLPTFWQNRTNTFFLESVHQLMTNHMCGCTKRTMASGIRGQILLILSLLATQTLSENPNRIISWKYGSEEYKVETIQHGENLEVKPLKQDLFKVFYDFEKRLVLYRDDVSRDCYVEEMSPYQEDSDDEIPSFLGIPDESSEHAEWCKNYNVLRILRDVQEEPRRVKRFTPVDEDDSSWFYRRYQRRLAGQTQAQLLKSQKCGSNEKDCDSDEARAIATNEKSESVVRAGGNSAGQAQSQVFPWSNPFPSWRDLDYNGRSDGRTRNSNGFPVIDNHRRGLPGGYSPSYESNDYDYDGQSPYQRRRQHERGPNIDRHRYGAPGTVGGFQTPDQSRGKNEQQYRQGQYGQGNQVNYRGGQVDQRNPSHQQYDSDQGIRRQNGGNQRPHVTDTYGTAHRPGSSFRRDSHTYGAPGTIGGLQNGLRSGSQFDAESRGSDVQGPDRFGYGTDASQSQTQVKLGEDESLAAASSGGGNGAGSTQTQVQGSYSGTGSFSAQSQSMGGWGQSSSSGIQGNKSGVSSQAGTIGQGSRGSQAQVQIGSGGGVSANAQSNFLEGGSSTNVQAGRRGGQSGAQASGQGITSSQAQIGFDQAAGRTLRRRVPDAARRFLGAGQASAQSQGSMGQSQSQFHGSFTNGLIINGAAQAGSDDLTGEADQLEQNGFPGSYQTRSGAQPEPAQGRQRGYGRQTNSERAYDYEPKGMEYDIGGRRGYNNSHAIPSTTQSRPSENEYPKSASRYGNSRMNGQRTFEQDRREYLARRYGSQGQGYPTQSQNVYVNGEKVGDAQVTRNSATNMGAGRFGQPRNGYYYPGESLPGVPGYRVPEGFKARIVESMTPSASATVNGPGQSQAQTINVNYGESKERTSVVNDSRTSQNNVSPQQTPGDIESYYNYDYSDEHMNYNYEYDYDRTTSQVSGGGKMPTQGGQIPGSGQGQYPTGTGSASGAGRDQNMHSGTSGARSKQDQGVFQRTGDNKYVPGTGMQPEDQTGGYRDRESTHIPKDELNNGTKAGRGDQGIVPSLERQDVSYPVSPDPELSTSTPESSGNSKELPCESSYKGFTPCANIPLSGTIRIHGEGQWKYYVPMNGAQQSKDSASAQTDNQSLPTSWQQKHYSSSSTCGYFTFSCNIVFGTNRRTKICKPLPVQCN